MKVKKIISLLLIAAMVMGIMTGCSSSDPEEETTGANGETESVGEEITETVAEEAGKSDGDGEVYKVAFLPTDMAATFASWLASELTTAFEAYDNMELTIIDSRNQLETQLGNLETSVAQGYDYIILLPLEPDAQNEIVEDIIADGTPMMMINLDNLQVEEASSVIANPYDLGTVVSEYSLTLLPEDANVVVLLGPSGNTDSIERRRAYEEIVFSQNPNITILDEQIGDWEKSKGMELMENWIQVHGENIDAVISMNDAMAIGAYEAAKATGVEENILYFGVDGLADAAVAISNGEMTATALQDAQVMAEEGARIVNEVLTGSNASGYEKVQIPVTLITDENVGDFVERYTENGMITGQ